MLHDIHMYNVGAYYKVVGTSLTVLVVLVTCPIDIDITFLVVSSNLEKKKSTDRK